MHHKLIILSGPSGVGKNTIISKFLEMQPLARFETPLTTRKIREKEEKNGIDYHFKEKEDFQKLIKKNKLCEWDYTLGNYYGFYNTIIEDSSMPIVITHALSKIALKLKYKYENTTIIFLKPTSYDIIIDRLKNRKKEMEILPRVQHGLDEEEHIDLFDYYYEDDDAGHISEKIMQIVSK